MGRGSYLEAGFLVWLMQRLWLLVLALTTISTDFAWFARPFRAQSSDQDFPPQPQLLHVADCSTTSRFCKNNETWPRHTDIRRKRPKIRVFRRIVPCPCPQSMPSPFSGPLVTASRIYLPMPSLYAFFAFLALLQACSSAASTTQAHLIPSVNAGGLAGIALPTHALDVFFLSSIVCNDSLVGPSEGVGIDILSCPVSKPMTLLRPR